MTSNRSVTHLEPDATLGSGRRPTDLLSLLRAVTEPSNKPEYQVWD
jgi:hypothetical protein